MNNSLKYILIGLALLAGAYALLGSSAQPDSSMTQDDVTISENTEDVTVDSSDYLSVQTLDIDTTTHPTLSDPEVAGLVFMREEEKLAHDVYTALYDMWGIPAFTNIAQSEATHMAAVKTLLDAYNIEDPVGTNSQGVFTNMALQELYTALVAQGSTSQLNALKVGAEIEDLDIKDLQAQLAQTNNASIIDLYQNLMKGSRNHLRSFVSLIEKQGATYEARHLTQDEVDIIANSPRERGKAVY